MTRKEQTVPGPLSPVAFHILLALADGSRHGYGIRKEVELRTDGALSPGSGTLYEAIQRLEDGGLIQPGAAPRGAPTDGRRRRYYRLTRAGRRTLTLELERLGRVLDYARSQRLVKES